MGCRGEFIQQAKRRSELAIGEFQSASVASSASVATGSEPE
jgi:hypothetical protein